MDLLLVVYRHANFQCSDIQLFGLDAGSVDFVEPGKGCRFFLLSKEQALWVHSADSVPAERFRSRVLRGSEKDTSPFASALAARVRAKERGLSGRFKPGAGEAASQEALR